MDTIPDTPTRFLLTAALAWAPAEGEAPRRFTMEAYDGGLLRLAGLPCPVVVDLRGMKAAPQVKALLHHNPARPVGHMDRVEIGNKITAEGLLSVPAHSGEIAAAQRNGFDWEASIGASRDAPFEQVDPGQTVSVNGRKFQGPILVVRKSTLREVSFTGVGAGDHTSAALTASAITDEDADMAKQAENTPVIDPASDPQNPAGKIDVQAAETTAELKALQIDIKAQLSGLKTETEALKAEREQLRRDRLVESVDHIAAKYGVDDPDLLTELKGKAEAGDVAETDVELQVLRASRAQRQLGGFAPIGNKSGGPAASHVIEAAICLTNGWREEELGKHFDEKSINAAIEARWSGFGFKGLMIEYLKGKGHDVVGGRLSADDIKAGIGFAEGETDLKASFSSISLPGITSNVARKEILRGYDSIKPAITKIARRGTTSDYKPFYMYRLNTSGLFQKIGPDGEFTSVALAEDEYTSRVYPWGRKLAITEVMFKNDDAGAFADLARLFGRISMKTVEKEGATVLLANESTFWTTGKANRVASGAGSALSLDSLEDGYNLMLAMEDSQSEPIDMEAKYLLTGPGGHVTAKSIHNSTIVNMSVGGTAGSQVTVERPANNQFVGMFEPVYSPYLGNGKVTNATGTQWLLCGDPAISSPVVVAYLDGRDTPQIRRWEAIAGRLGMQWDVSLHFGWNAHDDKASVLSPGA